MKAAFYRSHPENLAGHWITLLHFRCNQIKIKVLTLFIFHFAIKNAENHSIYYAKFEIGKTISSITFYHYNSICSHLC